MRARIALIVFYFGPFPDYFPFFLRSCGYNREITWHIYTDNKKRMNWPDNVIYHGMTFEECRQLFQSKFDYEISLTSPKKLCDYKPLYGYILEDVLKEYAEYDFWGHCDLDVICGRIEIPKDYFSNCDKIYSLGHFSLYRNNKECKRVILDYADGQRVKEVLQTKDMVAFDEWGSDNVNDIFEKSSLHFLGEPYGADIWPERYNIYRSEYNPKRNRYYAIEDSMGLLKKEHEKLFYYYKDGRVEEVPYVHLQKRKLAIACNAESDNYYITPDALIDGARCKGIEEMMAKCCRKPLIDRQFWKIKKINLSRRLKMIKDKMIK